MEVTEYFDRDIAVKMEYRDYMGKQVTALDNVQSSLDRQTSAFIAAQEDLRDTYDQGFDQVNYTIQKVNNTLQMGFAGLSNQLGSMTTSFNMGFAWVENCL